jgi:phage baseplate assembly protein W
MSNINKLYSDIDPEMRMDWNKDVARSVGLRSIKNSLLGIVTTRKGSRPFDPEFGCDLVDELFENMTPLTADTIERNIQAAVRNYEPRIDKLSVSGVMFSKSSSTKSHPNSGSKGREPFLVVTMPRRLFLIERSPTERATSLFQSIRISGSISE